MTSASHPVRPVFVNAGVRRAAAALLIFCSLWFPIPICSAEETIYLQSGEEFSGSITEITADSVRATIRGEERAFPLKDVHRIEFQRLREYDSLDTTAALSAASPLFGDALSLSTEELKVKYPQAGYVILRSDLVLTVGENSECSAERTLVWRILEQRGADSAFRSLSFFPESQKAEVLFAITVAPDGKVSRLADSSIKVESVHAGLPEYDYLKRMRFSLKNPVPGATLFLKTRVSGTAAALVPIVSDSVLLGYEPIVESTIRVAASPEALKSVSFASSGVERQADSLAWRVNDSPQIMPEPMMPPLAAFAPRVLIASPASTWPQLAHELLDKTGPSPIKSPEGTTARNVYDRVRRDVRTIGVPAYHLSRPPAAPKTVLDRGFGNDVEKTLLLEALLDGLGMEAHTVLVWSRAGGPMLPEVPRLYGYDNALVRLKNADSTETWLTADDRLAAFGEIPSDTEGAQGLDLATGDIVEVPTLGAKSSMASRTVDIAVAADGSAIVKEDYHLRGRSARQYRNLADMTDQEALKWAQDAVCEDVMAELTDWSHSDFDKANEEETLSFTYRIPALAQVSGGFLVFKLPNAKYSPVDVGSASRRYDLFWLGSEAGVSTFTVHAPEGYTAYSLREGVAIDVGGWKFSAAFEKADESGSAVVFREDWSRSAFQAPREAYQEYRKTLMTRGIVRNEVLVFKK